MADGAGGDLGTGAAGSGDQAGVNGSADLQVRSCSSGPEDHDHERTWRSALQSEPDVQRQAAAVSDLGGTEARRRVLVPTLSFTVVSLEITPGVHGTGALDVARRA